MSGTLSKPSYIKFRRESNGGLVYDHENYGYEDASMYAVSETVVDVLEYVGDRRPRAEVESEFSRSVVESLLERGVLTDAE